MEQNIEITRGDTASFNLQFVDFAGDLEHDVQDMFLTVKEDINGSVLFQKSLGNGISKVIDNVYVVRIAPEDTEDLNLGFYYYDFEVKINDDVFTLLKGVMQIAYDVTDPTSIITIAPYAELQDIRVGYNGDVYPSAGDAVRDQVNDLHEEVNVLDGRMDEFASLPEGSTAGNAELVDIRIGANGITYPSAGDAVRGQVEELDDKILDNATDIGDINSDVDVLKARMDTFASLPDGSTAGDAELEDIRVGANGVTYASAGDAVRGQVDKLSKSINNNERVSLELCDRILNALSVRYCGGTNYWLTRYNTSTFSGFESSWQIQEKTILKSLSVGLAKRSTGNAITKVRFRISTKQMGDSDFLNSVLFDETKDVNITSESKSTIVFELSELIYCPQGETLYFYAQANEVCTWAFENTSDNSFNYRYFVNGSLADVGGSSGCTYRLELIANTITILKDNLILTNNIVDGAVTVEKTSFAEIQYSANLFDPATMATDEAWAYSGSPQSGGLVYINGDQYTTAYTALKIPIPEDAENISIMRYSGTTGYIYSYYFTDADSKCISYEYNVQYQLSSGKTLTVPTGAVYLYITLRNGHDYNTMQLMISATAQPIPYVEYKAYVVIPNLKVDGSASEWMHDAVLSLPDKYELVVGDTFELFYQGIVKASHWDDFDVEVVCTKGNAFERKYVFTPTVDDIGSITCVVNLYDPYHRLMDAKIVLLVVKNKASSPLTGKNVLYVSDSLANGGHAPGEFKRRLVGSGGTPSGDALSNITFIGTCDNGYVNYEGYGGWTWNSYNTANSSNAYMWITASGHDKTEADDQHSIYEASNGTQWKLETIQSGQIKIIRVSGSSALPSTGTLTWVSGGIHHNDITYTASSQASGNPFWDESEGKVDFAKYATALGASSIDFVYVLLGWNSSGTNEETTKQQVKTFIENVFASFPNCKIVLLGLQCPARDGLANNYGASGILAHFYSALNHVCNLNEWYADVASDYENVSFVNIAGQFDTKYNMPSTSMPVNVRNSTTVSIQSNGVHPAQSGYYQIADACYRDIMHKLQN